MLGNIILLSKSINYDSVYNEDYFIGKQVSFRFDFNNMYLKNQCYLVFVQVLFLLCSCIIEQEGLVLCC